MQEIERKYLVTQPPSLGGFARIVYERYFLEISDDKEIRIQRKDDTYERQEKTVLNALEATKLRQPMTKEEFETLRCSAIASISRDKIALSQTPRISLTIYHGIYEGLMRAEVEFDSVDVARAFTAPNWFGKEITSTPLARDRDLCKLSKAEFEALLARYR